MPSATRSSAASAPVVANMVREAHGYKYHWAVADYLQRAARHVASKVDVEQAYAVGKAAVEYALAGMNAVMPAIKRRSSQPVSMADRAGAARPRWPTSRRRCRANSSPPTASASPAACRRYLEPLIAGEDYPPYRDGLPAYVRIKGAAVRRRLKTDFKL